MMANHLLADYEKDIARLVLNYLHQQRLFDAYRVFCSSSPHLADIWQRQQTSNCQPYALFRPGGQSLYDLLRLHNAIENYALDLPPDKGALLAALESSEQRLLAILRAVDEQKLRCIKRRLVQNQHDVVVDGYAIDIHKDNAKGAPTETDETDYNTPTDASQRRQHYNTNPNGRRPFGAAAAIHSFATSTACVALPSAAKRQKLSQNNHLSHLRQDEHMPSPIVDTPTTTNDDENRTPTSAASGGSQPTVLAKKLAQQRSHFKKAALLTDSVQSSEVQQQQHQPSQIAVTASDTATAEASSAMPADYDAMMIDLDSLLESTCFHQVLADSINNVLHTPNNADDAPTLPQDVSLLPDAAADTNAEQVPPCAEKQPDASVVASAAPTTSSSTLQGQLNSDVMNAIVNTATGDPSFDHLVQNMMQSNLAPDVCATTAATTTTNEHQTAEPFRSRLRARRPLTMPRTCYLTDGPKRSYQRRSVSKTTPTVARDASTDSTASVCVLSNETYDGRLGSAEQMLNTMQQQQQQHQQQQQVLVTAEVPVAAVSGGNAAPGALPAPVPLSPSMALIAPPPPGHFYALPAAAGDITAIDTGTGQSAQLISVSSAGVQRYVLLNNWGVIEGVTGPLETGAIIDVSNNIYSSTTGNNVANWTTEITTAPAITAATPAESQAEPVLVDPGTLNQSSDKENNVQPAEQATSQPAQILTAAPTACTDTPPVVSLQLLKSKALSTPRRHSHVRVLDFNTPAPNTLEFAAAAAAIANGAVPTNASAPDAPSSAPPKLTMHQQQQSSMSSNVGSGDDAKEETMEPIVAKSKTSTNRSAPGNNVRRKTKTTTAIETAVDEESLPIAALNVPLAASSKSTANIAATSSAKSKSKLSQRKAAIRAQLSAKARKSTSSAANVSSELAKPEDSMTVENLEAWQQLRSIKMNDWDNHMRKQCANMPIKQQPRAPPRRKKRDPSKSTTAAVSTTASVAEDVATAPAKPKAPNNVTLDSSALCSPDSSLTSLHGDMLAAALNKSVDSGGTLLAAIAEETETGLPTNERLNAAHEKDAPIVQVTAATSSKTPKKTERFSIKLPLSSKKKSLVDRGPSCGLTTQMPSTAVSVQLRTPLKVAKASTTATSSKNKKTETATAQNVNDISATTFDSSRLNNISDHTDDGNCSIADHSAVPPTPRLTMAALQSADGGTANVPPPRCASAASAGDMSELRYGDSDACQTPTLNGCFPKTPGVGATTPSPVYSPATTPDPEATRDGGGSSYYRPDESDDLVLPPTTIAPTTMTVAAEKIEPMTSEQTIMKTTIEDESLPPSSAGIQDNVTEITSTQGTKTAATDCSEDALRKDVPNASGQNEDVPSAQDGDKHTNISASSSSSSNSSTGSISSTATTSSSSSSSSSSVCSSRPSSVASEGAVILAAADEQHPQQQQSGDEHGHHQQVEYDERVQDSKLEQRRSLHDERYEKERLDQEQQEHLQRLQYEQQVDLIQQASAAEERQRQADAEAAEAEAQVEAERRYAAQTAQAAQLAEARERTKNRLKVEVTRESFKTQATLAHRKQKLAQQQGFAAAVAAAAQQKPLQSQPLSCRVGTASEASTSSEAVTKAANSLRTKSVDQKQQPPIRTTAAANVVVKKPNTIPARRKTICLPDVPVVPVDAAGRRKVRRPSVLKAGKNSQAVLTEDKTRSAPSTKMPSSSNNAEPQPQHLSRLANMPWTSPDFVGFTAIEAATPTLFAAPTADLDSSDGEAFPKTTRIGRLKKMKKKNPVLQLEDVDDTIDAENPKETTPKSNDTEATVIQSAIPIPTVKDVGGELPPSPPEQPSYTSSYATTTATVGYSAQARHLFGDAVDSDFMDTPVKVQPDDSAALTVTTPDISSGTNRLSDVLPALALMPTPQKTSTPNEELRHKRITVEPLGTAATAIVFSKPSSSSTAQLPIKMPAKKRKDATVASNLVVDTNPMLAAMETPVKQPPVIAVPLNSSAETRAAVASLNITPLHGIAVDLNVSTTATALNNSGNDQQAKHDGSSAASEEDDDDDSEDAYDACTLLSANEVRTHVGFAEYRYKDDGRAATATFRSQDTPTAAAKITTMDVRLDDITVRLRATDAIDIFEQAPKKALLLPPPPVTLKKTSGTSGSAARGSKASVKVSTSTTTTTTTKRLVNSSLGVPLQKSTPLIIPKVRVSYKGSGTVLQKPKPASAAAVQPTDVQSTVQSSTATALEQLQRRENVTNNTSAASTKNLRVFDVNLVLGKVHPS